MSLLLRSFRSVKRKIELFETFFEPYRYAYFSTKKKYWYKIKKYSFAVQNIFYTGTVDFIRLATWWIEYIVSAHIIPPFPMFPCFISISNYHSSTADFYTEFRFYLRRESNFISDRRVSGFKQWRHEICSLWIYHQWRKSHLPTYTNYNLYQFCAEL